MLTFNATVARLLADGRLVRFEVPLEPGDQLFRVLFCIPDFVTWFEDELPGIPRFWDAVLEPDEQVYGLLLRYVLGQALAYGREYHPLRPVGDGVWELKTADVRIFGWFGQVDCFVATFGAAADRVKRYGLYHGFKTETLRIRAELGLPFVFGSDADDVLSSAN